VPVVVLVVGAVVTLLSTLFGLAFIIPVGDAFDGPWLFIPAAAPAPVGGPPEPPCRWASAGLAVTIAALAAAAISALCNINLLRLDFAPVADERVGLRPVCLGSAEGPRFTFACHSAPTKRCNSTT
jgi:hypothetical protein